MILPRTAHAAFHKAAAYFDVKPVIVGFDATTYKADVDDTRESPAMEIAELLAHKGYVVRVYDPHAPAPHVRGAHATSSVEEATRGADVVAVLVDHVEFRTLSPARLSGMRGRSVVDTRNFLDVDLLRRGGFSVTVLGSAR